MSAITLYSKNYCGYCTAAKALLHSNGYTVQEINLEGDFAGIQDVMARSGQRTLPQIFVNDKPVGGYRELAALIASGEFAELLSQT